MSKKRALILGIAGQDGSYLAEYLLSLGYEVHGLVRRSSVDNLWRIAHIKERLTLYRGDLADHGSIERVLNYAVPDEIYNLADQDDEGWSYFVPAYNLDITAGAVGRLLESAHNPYTLSHKVRVLQPISAKIFGDAKPRQYETTRINPQSPYACAKAHAYHLVKMYREVHNEWVANVILYNHDSPRRGEGYLLQTICRRALDVWNGLSDHLVIGDPKAVVDIGFAGDYVKAMHAALQVDKPDDYLIGSGQPITVGELATIALSLCGCSSKAIVTEKGFSRPGAPQTLIGCIDKAQSKLGFSPKTSHTELIKMILNKIKGTV